MAAMQRFWPLFLGPVLGSLVLTPVFASHLVSQTTKGTHRECVYDVRPGLRLSPSRASRSVRVGLGEPCPQRFPRPETEQIEIPRLATLRAQQLVGTSLICTYSYNGRDYYKTLSPTARCPLTPNF